jgi:selenocysteine lyase/cysteine desulfurase
VLAAVDYLASLGKRSNGSRREALKSAYAEIHAHELRLTEKLISGLLAIPGVTVYGITDPARFDQRVGTVSLRVKGRSPHDIATHLGDRGLFTWDGNFYALDLTERLGVEDDGGLVRIGMLHYNSEEEIERLLGELRGLA